MNTIPMTLIQARQHLLDLVLQGATDKPWEQVPLSQALHRVLAVDVVAPLDVPAFDVSMMDGYAACLNDLVPHCGENAQGMTVSQRIPAGCQPQPLERHTAVRLFTGAPIPPEADVVIPQEAVVVLNGTGSNVGDEVRFDLTLEALQSQRWIRAQGSDCALGETILKQGEKCTPAMIGLAASMGLATLPVYPALTVVTFTTGDELVEPGKSLSPGKIYNANRYWLQALVQQLGFELIDMGTIADDLQAAKRALSQASEWGDVIITTGGVSVGEEDHLKPAVDALGALQVWQVAMKPGKPLAYGHVNHVPFVGLPGNPVSAFTTFGLFALPVLKALSGETVTADLPVQAATADFVRHQPSWRAELLRGKRNANGEVRLYSNQNSGVLSSMHWADGYALVPENTTVVQGQAIDFIPFNDLFR